MVRINWTEQAVKDLAAIRDFIAEDSRKYAIIHIKRLKEKTSILSSKPKIGRVVLEIGQETIRELIHGNYRIVYEIKSKTEVHILTIHHSARLLK